MSFTLRELLEKYTVTIPQIQRDYAQGRSSETGLRKNFIRKIKKSLTVENVPLNLDFVYGYTKKAADNEFIFFPIDGQQRITTLWLIHWLVAPRVDRKINGRWEKILNDAAQKMLLSFTYKTRLSSKRFCESLVKEPLLVEGNATLSMVIKDASWFMASWQNDPTVISMLNMLDTLQEESVEDQSYWDLLTVDRRVTFDFIDIKSDEFKLNDELYIKMNSRGRALTSFENFKAQFSGLLAQQSTEYYNDKLTYQGKPVSYQQYFAFNIDGRWMDLFWKYSVRHKLKVDDCFLNFIYYVAEFLYYKSNPNSVSSDIIRDFDFLASVFSSKKHVALLFNSFDFLISITDVSVFFDSLFESLSMFDEYSKDYFLRAITNIGFDVKDKVIFYSVLHYCIQHNINAPDQRLKDFTRIVRNLLLAARQVNQKKLIEYATSLRFPSVSEYTVFIEPFIEQLHKAKNKSVYEVFAANEYRGFSRESISYEKQKAQLLFSSPSLQPHVHAMEEHPEIQGNTSNFKLDSENIVTKIKSFMEIWSDEIDNAVIVRAFLTVGDYSVKTHKNSSLGKIWFLGCKGYWNRILTAIDKEERKKVSETLDVFLERYNSAIGNSSNAKLEFIIEKFSPDKSAEWRYYFVKYMHIVEENYGRFNLYSWKEDNGYEINSLGNSGKQPLFSYHINPYLIQLELKFEDYIDIEIKPQRYTDISFLQVSNKFKLYCIVQGWLIIPMNIKSIGSSIASKYKLSSSNGGYILKETTTKDRIEIAIDFIEEFI